MAEMFHYRGYSIPERLAVLTGGGGHTFEAVAQAQLSIIDRLAPIKPDHRVLEVGCGVGKLAIPLTKMLSPKGQYFGVDIIEDSINWCKNNISIKNNNFKFYNVDTLSHMYNPSGKMQAFGVQFPFEDETFDRIILYSVFTHMFEPDIRNYLEEFRRLLVPGGTVLATWFLIDEETLRLVQQGKSLLGSHIQFRYRISMGCYVNVIDAPLGAVGYTLPYMEEMVKSAGLRVRELERGYWSPLYPPRGQSGQDTTILEISDDG